MTVFLGIAFFFEMTTALPSLGRNFRFPSAIVVTSRRFPNSVASGWDISWYNLTSRAIGLSREGAWSMAVSFLFSEVEFQAIFGPHLIVDLSIGPDCVSYLGLAVEEGHISAVKRRWLSMSRSFILGERWAWRGWTMRTVS